MLLKCVYSTIFVTALASGFVAAQENKKTTKPNIVVILADDIGVGDISFYNKYVDKRKVVIETTNIDQLAENGVWFSDAHSATTLCAPTRYAVMTGKNNYRSYAPWGVWGSFKTNAISNHEPTLANVVKDKGYTTGFVGKWHLGGDFNVKNSKKIYRGTDEGDLPNVDLTKMVGGGPNDIGFDYSFMLPDGIQGPLYLAYENQHWFPLAKGSALIHLTEQTALSAKTVSDKGDGMGDSGWQTEAIGDVISQKAADFIIQNSVKNDNAPFMLYYASPMAHIPHMPPVKFGDQKVKGTTPSAHLDMVFELDLQIGRIVDALRATNNLTNTLIIFTSDNGGLRYRSPGTYESGHRVSGIYRGSKNTPYEGGHRVPFIVHWPEKITRQQLATPILVQDILATIAQAAGNNLSTAQAPDSKSILPLVSSKMHNDKPYQARNYLMQQGGSNTEIIYREQHWKLIMKSDHKLSHFTPFALFNLSENLQEIESQNLISSPAHQKLIENMRLRYLQKRQSKEPTI